ncbi:ATP-binding cassette sub-family D member 4-like [Tropilaelaps mercedesae]|uniref:ATP-binding cassette sub-family D member 4-like n=1 Tax=Tropilaelaps mercedesae TaxID=418985 RepID=A0A1V9X7D8_9ACAR|nr:ATP-binding cassette sub-family D member 4-like [Tropilaelaps mercedesae]
MPPAEVKIDFKDVEYSKLPNIIVELWRIFMTVFRQSKLFCSFLPLLCMLEGIDQALDYQQGMIMGDLIGSVSRRDTPAFSTLMIWIGGISLLDAIVSTFKGFLTGYATVMFRQILTRQLHKKYFRQHNFYKVNCRERISNPDQRIGSDVEVLGDYLCWMISTILTTPFTITYYVFQVGLGLGWIYPFIIVGYFFLVVVFSKMLRKPIVPRVCKVKKMEGRFRQQHLDVVENAERIAFVHGGDDAEYVYTEMTFKKLLRASKIVQFLYIPVYFVMRLDNRMVYVVTYVICGMHIFAMQDGLSESEISSEWTKIVFVVSNLGWMCHKYVYIINFLIYIEAMIRRVSELMAGMDDTASVINDQGTNDDEPRYSVRNLTIVGPSGRTLVSQLNMDITVRTNILVAGPSNIGKTSLLRVLRKLWTPTEGQVCFTGQSSAVMYIAQQVFFGDACCTLRKTVVYPLGRHSVDDVPAIEHVLKTLRLCHVLKSVDNNLDKELEGALSVLSSGERQRLALARVLFHRPRIVFLDEATNALDTELVEIFFEECRLAGITTVTVSHNRENLYQFHDHVLEIGRDGTWCFEPTENYLNKKTV